EVAFRCRQSMRSAWFDVSFAAMRAFAFSMTAAFLLAVGCRGSHTPPAASCGDGRGASPGCSPAPGPSNGPFLTPLKVTIKRGDHIRVVAEARVTPGLEDAAAPSAGDMTARLRSSIADLVRVLRIAGASTDVVADESASTAEGLTIYVGAPARRVFGD